MVQKIPESRSTLQSGFEKSKNVAHHSLVQNKEIQAQLYNNHDTW